MRLQWRQYTDSHSCADRSRHERIKMDTPKNGHAEKLARWFSSIAKYDLRIFLTVLFRAPGVGIPTHVAGWPVDMGIQIPPRQNRSQLLVYHPDFSGFSSLRLSQVRRAHIRYTVMDSAEYVSAGQATRTRCLARTTVSVEHRFERERQDPFDERRLTLR